MTFSYTVPPGDAPAPVRLDAFLSRVAERSRTYVQEQIAAGRVAVNGAVATKLSHKLRAGDQVTGEFREESTALRLEPIAGPLDILFEDDALLVINKAQGVVVHPAVGHRGETLVHYLLHHLRQSAFHELSPTRPGIVHRLDRGTSGVLLVAKSRVVQENLSHQFKSRQIQKEYEAIVWGRPPAQGTFQSVIGRDRANRKKMSSRTEKGRAALTRFQSVREFAHFAHLALFPHTGRTHQLRVHLAEARFPIVGDALYGGTVTPKRIERLPPPVQQKLLATRETYLHAKSLRLSHPMTHQPLQFTAPRPENFAQFLLALSEEDRT